MTSEVTRRALLAKGMWIPLVGQMKGESRSETPLVISERNCLSEESAQGFRLILEGQAGSRNLSIARELIVLAGASTVTRQQALRLRKRAQNGAWVIWEMSPVLNRWEFEQQRAVLRESFAIELSEPILLSSNHLQRAGMYVRFVFPQTTVLTRAFMAIVPIRCSMGAVTATYDDVPVAARFRAGLGGIVWLGSMIGTNVRAGEREATKIASTIAGATHPNPAAWRL